MGTADHPGLVFLAGGRTGAVAAPPSTEQGGSQHWRQAPLRTWALCCAGAHRKAKAFALSSGVAFMNS